MIRTSDHEEEEEEVKIDSDDEVHNYAEIRRKITKDSLIGQKLLGIFEKDPRPTVERKKKLAKNLNIPYDKLNTWFNSRRNEGVKGNLSNNYLEAFTYTYFTLNHQLNHAIDGELETLRKTFTPNQIKELQNWYNGDSVEVDTLVESTGLTRKQINDWICNQRKKDRIG